MRTFILAISILLGSFFMGGCSSTPDMQAKEVRALYSEAQVQVAKMKGNPNYDQSKVNSLDSQLSLYSPLIDELEILAIDPQKGLNFQLLYLELKPKVEAFVLQFVLNKMLGV